MLRTGIVTTYLVLRYLVGSGFRNIYPTLWRKSTRGNFRLPDYALRDSLPSRPSLLAAERCEHSRIRLAAVQAQIANSLCVRENRTISLLASTL